MNDDNVSKFLSSFDRHVEDLKGLHLDLSNTEVSSKVIKKTVKTVKSCDNLISLGLDLGNCSKLSEQCYSILIDQLSLKSNKFVSLALGFHNSKVISSIQIDKISSLLLKHKSSLKMLRLNYSNTNITSENLITLISIIDELELDHLELFLGGNTCVTNAIVDSLI